MTPTALQQAHRHRQKARGLCLYCPEPVALDRLGRPTRRCVKHLEVQRASERRRQAKLRLWVLAAKACHCFDK